MSVDQKRANVVKFLDSQPRWSLTIAHDPRQQIADTLQPEKMPTSYAIDRAGVIRYVNGGFEPSDAPVIERKLAELAGGESASGFCGRSAVPGQRGDRGGGGADKRRRVLVGHQTADDAAAPAAGGLAPVGLLHPRGGGDSLLAGRGRRPAVGDEARVHGGVGAVPAGAPGLHRGFLRRATAWATGRPPGVDSARGSGWAAWPSPPWSWRW